MATILEFPTRKPIVVRSYISVEKSLHARLAKEADERGMILEDYMGKLMGEYCGQTEGEPVA